MAEKDFEKFLEQQKQGKKDNPITTDTDKKKKKEPPQYKSIRIYPDDFKDFKRIAFEEEMHIVELVSEALELIKKKYDKK